MNKSKLVAVSNDGVTWELAMLLYKCKPESKVYPNKYYCQSVKDINKKHYWTYARDEFRYDSVTNKATVKLEYVPFDEITILPHKDKWIKGDFFGENGLGRIETISSKGLIVLGVHKCLSYSRLLANYTFEDGSPCGVLKEGISDGAI